MSTDAIRPLQSQQRDFGRITGTRDLRLSASNFCFNDLQGALFSGIRAAREVNEAVN
jgi:hypothetical protein